MKLSSFVAKVSTPLVIFPIALSNGAPAEARPSMGFCGTTEDALEYCVGPIGHNGIELVVTNPYNGNGFIASMNCSNGKYQWRTARGYNQSRIEKLLISACRA